MKNYTSIFIIARAVFTAALFFLLPTVHLQWGQPYPEEGKGMGILLIFIIMSGAAGISYFALGSLGHFILHRTPRRVFIFDISLLILFVVALLYIGLSARIT